ncbi:MAG: hypothetical protein ABI614_27460, partial [Planctomycetota bacterium]
AFATPEISEQLALSEPQRDELRAKGAELTRDFSKKMNELRLEMREKLLAELNPEQRAKFQEMLGDPFEFQDRPPGGN